MFDWSWWPSRIPSLYGRLKTLESKLIQEKKWGRSVESVMIQISTICFGLVHITWGILILEVFQHLQIFICIRKQKKKMAQNFQHHEHLKFSWNIDCDLFMNWQKLSHCFEDVHAYVPQEGHCSLTQNCPRTLFLSNSRQKHEMKWI